jgi:hypothetical protein
LRGGLEVGLPLAVLVLLLGTLVGNRPWLPWLTGGVVAGVAATIALDRRDGLPGEVLAGLWLLLGAGIAGWLGRRALGERGGLAIACGAALPGALLVATSSSTPDVTWVRVLVVATSVGAGPAAAWWERAAGREVGGLVLLVVSTGAMWTTVPDTERSLVLLGATAPLAAVAWDPRRWRLGVASPMVMTTLVWVATQDGAARPGSIVGAAGGLGVLLVGPVVARLAWVGSSRGDRVAGLGHLALLVALHAACAAWAARVSGLSRTAAGATASLVPALVVTGLALAVWERRARPPDGGWPVRGAGGDARVRPSR